jgi:hypothetical protein
MIFSEEYHLAGCDGMYLAVTLSYLSGHMASHPRIQQSSVKDKFAIL